MKKVRLLIVLLTVFFILSCGYNYNYRTTKSLRRSYSHVVSGDGIKFFYKIKGNALDITLKNISGAMYKNLELEIEDNSGQVNVYKSFNNVKNLSVRNFILRINNKTRVVNIKFRYFPLREDIFLNPNRNIGDIPSIRGLAKIYVKRR